MSEQIKSDSSETVEVTERVTLKTSASDAVLAPLQTASTSEVEFASELTNKLSHATMPGARQLAEIVGDPESKEHQWYEACEAAGEADLSGKPSTLRVVSFRAAAVLGVVFSFLSIMLCYVASVYLGSDYGSMFLKVSTNNFLNDLVGLDYVGFFIAGGASICYWASFFNFFKRTFRYLTIALFIGVMIHSVNFHLLIGIPASALCGVALIPLLYLAEWLGGVCRDALPMHIGSKKLAASLMPALIFPAMAMALTLCIVAQMPAPERNTDYLNGSFLTMAFNTFSVFLCTLIPGFVLARSTKSKSPSGSATLAVSLQTPLLLGLLFSTLACVIFAILSQCGAQSNPAFGFMGGLGGGDWAGQGLTKALAIGGSILVASLSASGGGALGAWWNNRFGVTDDKNPTPRGEHF